MMRGSSATAGQLPRVIASYNAGPLPVARWAGINDKGDPLLWIESIPYWETRYYVPAVLRNMWVYQGLNDEDNADPQIHGRASLALASRRGMTRAHSLTAQFLICSLCFGYPRPCRSSRASGAGRPAMRPRRASTCKERVAEGEWLDQVEALDGVPQRRTTVTIEHPKSILTRNSSPDVGFDRSINAYRGCEHGCIYCFARPTHAFHDLSPGVDFESRLFVKPKAAQLLHAALSRPGYECRPIAMGTNTDPYQPIEERWRVTRSLVELLLETRHPFTITTKSDRVLARSRPAQAGRRPAHRLGRAVGDVARPQGRPDA